MLWMARAVPKQLPSRLIMMIIFIQAEICGFVSWKKINSVRLHSFFNILSGNYEMFFFSFQFSTSFRQLSAIFSCSETFIQMKSFPYCKMLLLHSYTHTHFNTRKKNIFEIQDSLRVNAQNKLNFATRLHKMPGKHLYILLIICWDTINIKDIHGSLALGLSFAFEFGDASQFKYTSIHLGFSIKQPISYEWKLWPEKCVRSMYSARVTHWVGKMSSCFEISVWLDYYQNISLL